ncbi:MAG: hypothetical protein HYW51_01045 [Candidatus Doudnabacteria bacterium]|nr:hypothetical protein [Candidatus Doudnabacteria bacterium]
MITFYNWECPPRFLDIDGGISYLVDLDKIFKGQKIDKFTELPRVVSQSKREIRILKKLNSLGLKYRFVKIIADTNAYYLTPESLQRYGEQNVKRKFLEFKTKIEGGILKYPARTKVFLFTELIKDYQQLYDKSFQKALKLLKQDKLVSKWWIAEQLKRTKEHVGINEAEKLQEFCFRTIASYAAEGLVFGRLSKTRFFANCVWLNIEEADERTITITNSLRIKEGKDPLPMLFM